MVDAIGIVAIVTVVWSVALYFAYKRGFQDGHGYGLREAEYRNISPR
jgi:hypothetical protein